MCIKDLPIFLEALVDSRARRRLENLAAVLPTVDGAILECRLGGDPGALVGFSAALCHSEARAWSLPERWPALGPFFNAWQGLDRQMNGAVTHIGLEFDMDVDSERAPPSLFASLRRGLPGSEQCELALRFAKLLDCPSAQIASAARILDVLPASAQVFCLGCMVSRQPRALRLNIGGLNADAILECLTAAGLIWARVAFEARLRAVSAWSHDLVLVLDAVPGTTPRHFGIECFGADCDGDVWWRSGLDWLVGAGLCTASKREALLRWPGDIPCTIPVTSWLDFMNPQPRAGRLVKAINHIKLSCRQGGDWDAKAYLTYSHEDKVRVTPA